MLEHKSVSWGRSIDILQVDQGRYSKVIVDVWDSRLDDVLPGLALSVALADSSGHTDVLLSGLDPRVNGSIVLLHVGIVNLIHDLIEVAHGFHRVVPVDGEARNVHQEVEEFL